MEAIVVVQFDYKCLQEELDALAVEFAERVKPTMDGLVWKIFLNEPEKHRAGGVHLFRDAESAGAYVEGAYVQGLREGPVVSNVSAAVFGTMPGPSIQAGAPLHAGVAR
jgi:hypothetical protein